MRATGQLSRESSVEIPGRVGGDVPAGVPDCVRALLRRAIDYAGLFPPAGLSMSQAVANYAGYRAGRHAWALGRFVVPVARLDEFMVALGPQPASGRWRLSALAGSPSPATDLVKVAAFNEHYPERARIDAVELGPDAALSIAAALQLADGRFATFHELLLAEDCREQVAEFARAGVLAKIRTGGTTPEAIPEPANVARFLCQAGAAGLGFKATAGLHHAIRGLHPLTGERDGPIGVMHGFLNILLAAAFAREGWDAGQLTEVLGESAPTAFPLERESIGWGGHRLSAQALAAARAEFLTSFGSCSFEEPIAELEALGWLPA